MAENKKSHMRDMTVGSPLKHILVFSVPMLIGNIFQQSYNMADSMIVGKFVSSDALAAVNTSMPIVFLMIALFMGLGMGATIMLSQFYGAGDFVSVQKTVKTINTCIILISIPLTIIGIVISWPLIRLLNVPEGIQSMAASYMIIVFIGLVGSFGFNINAGILQGLGDSRSPLYFIATACVMNIGLDFLFVAGFKTGVVGAAVATAISQWFSWIFGIFFIRKKYPELNFNPFKFGVDGQILKGAIRIGLPSGVQQSLFSVGLLFMQRLVNSVGEDFIAGFAAANRLDTFVFLPIMTFSSALATYTGQNVGAGKIERVRRGLYGTIIMAVSLSSAMMVMLLVFGRPLLTLFTDNPAVIDAGMLYLNEILPFYALLGVQFMYTSVLRGAGDTIIPMFITLFAFLLCRIPAAYIITHFFGPEKMFYSYGIGWVVSFGISLSAYYSGRWKNKGVVVRTA